MNDTKGGSRRRTVCPGSAAIFRSGGLKTNCSILVFSSDAGSCFLVRCAIGVQNVHGNPACTQHGSPTTINAHTIFLHSGNNKLYDMPPPMAGSMPPPMAGSMSTAGPTASLNEFATCQACTASKDFQNKQWQGGEGYAQ